MKNTLTKYLETLS